jgi:Predicted membrane-associated Zn-dependent proteases 1
MTTVLSFIIVLGILIFVHELGHFLLAKAFGVRVLQFSLGFGGKLIARQWGETEYLISAFPLGGYVKMYGEHQEEEIPPEDRHRSFTHKAVWQRFCIVFGGPLFNLLFAMVLFFGMAVFAGIPEPAYSTRIGEVIAGSAAEQVGVKAGDVVRSINSAPVTSWYHVSERIRDSRGEAVTLVVDRQGQELIFTATPTLGKAKNLFGEEEGEPYYMIGIGYSKEVSYKAASFGESCEAALLQTWHLSYLTVMFIVKMIQQVVPVSELGGPILIAELAGQRMEAGWMEFLFFMGGLSVNLAILNLLPVPVLDGGHLVFLSLEAVRRKPLGDRAMEISQQFGIAILVTLMVFVFYNDILRLVKRWMIS